MKNLCQIKDEIQYIKVHYIFYVILSYKLFKMGENFFQGNFRNFSIIKIKLLKIISKNVKFGL